MYDFIRLVTQSKGMDCAETTVSIGTEMTVNKFVKSEESLSQQKSVPYSSWPVLEFVRKIFYPEFFLTTIF